jgi:hypothetical protein
VFKIAFVSGLMMISAAPSFACEGEAQVIAKVEAVIWSNGQGCKVTLADFTHYAENQLCPLDLIDVNNIGLSIGEADAKVCTVKPGDTISGVMAKQGDKIVLVK